MKQNVSSGVFIGIIAVIVVIVAVVSVMVFRAPSAGPAGPGGMSSSGGASPTVRQTMDASMKEAHGPSQDQLKRIQDYKRDHPGATTRY